MKHDFKDILAATKETPTWWDENGTPRFSGINPKDCPDIYADEVVFFLIECQNCERKFIVQTSSKKSQRMLRNSMLNISEPTSIEDAMRKGLLDVVDYGDPPIHGCTGDVMSSYPIKILQFWSKLNASHTFERKYDLEVDLPNMKDEDVGAWK